MWRILSKREIDSGKLAATKRDRIAEERCLFAHGGSYHEDACRGRFYRAYARQRARRGL